MSYVIVVCPKLSDRIAHGNTYYFLGYKNGTVQTTDSLNHAAVISGSTVDALISKLQTKSDHVYTKHESGRRANWSMQRLRTPKVKIQAKKIRTKHYPKIKKVNPKELAKLYEEFCNT